MMKNKNTQVPLRVTVCGHLLLENLVSWGHSFSLSLSLSGIPETHPGIMASLNALNHSILCAFTWDVDRDKIMSLTYQNLALRTLEIIQRWAYQRSILLPWVMIVCMSRI